MGMVVTATGAAVEEMNGGLVCRKLSAEYGQAHAIEYVVTMGFNNHLNTSIGHHGQKTSHCRLAHRVDVGFRAVNDQNLALFCQQARNDNRQHVS